MERMMMEWSDGKIRLVGTLHENGLSADIWLLDQQDDEPEFNWVVKWDGCVNFQTSPSCMGHLCQKEDWQRIYDAGCAAYDLGMSMMGNKALSYAEPTWASPPSASSAT